MVLQALSLPIRRLGFLLCHLEASTRHNRLHLPQHLPKPQEIICISLHRIHPIGYRYNEPHQKFKNGQKLDFPYHAIWGISRQY
jgi:hypothetical protein